MVLTGRLCPLRSGTGEPSWSCVHRNGVAGMKNTVLAHQQAHQPDRGLERGWAEAKAGLFFKSS